jgi:hydroxyacylglutathione hydrolase
VIEGLRLWLAGTNAWIIAPQGPGGECVLVDAPPEPRVILHRLREHGLRLVALLTTHGHVDHVGGIGEVVAHAHDGMRPEAAGGPVPIHLHHRDRHMLMDPVGTGGTLAQMLDMENLRIPPPEIVFGLDDGQKVSGAGMTFTALHTPGHTQGSVCFLL